MDTHDDRGWVRPVAAGADSAFMDPIEPTGRTIRSSIVGGIILVAVVAAAIAGTVIWRGRNGDPFASARSIPADMDFVITFDAVGLGDSERLQALVDAFAEPLVAAGEIDEYPQDLVLAIDEAMSESSGFTLMDDILPWIGRSVSLAARVPDIDLDTFQVEELSGLLSADVRDMEKAAAFVDKVLAEFTDNGVEVAAASVGGLPGYRWEEDGISIAFVLTDSALLLGIESDVASAIEARDAGLSIAEDAVFQDTMERLPEERMVAVYVASSAVDGFVDLAARGMPTTDLEYDDQLFTSVGSSVSLTDEGLLFSYVMVGVDETGGVIAPDSDVLATLPDDTLGFLSIAASGTAPEGFDELALADMGYPLEGISSQLGVDIGTLIEAISGSLTVAVTETRDSVIAQQTDVPVGIVGALGLTDSGPVNDLVASLEDILSQQGADFDRGNGATNVSIDGQPIVSYATVEDMLVIGTSDDLVSRVSSGTGGGLTNSPLYQELDAAIAGDGLVFYIDLGRVVGLVPMTSDEAAVLAPLRGIGFGGEVDGDAVAMEVLVLIDY